MDLIRKLLIIPQEKRFRMVWRLLGQTILLGVVVIPANVLLGFLTLILLYAEQGEGIFEQIDPEAVTAYVLSQPLLLLASSLATLIGVVLSMWAAARLLDRRPLVDFGLRLDRAWWRDLGFGLLLGALLMVLIFVVELALGWVVVTGTFRVAGDGAFAPAIVVPLLQFVMVGIYEEMLNRGYHLSNLAQGLSNLVGPRAGLLAGWVLSSAVFGLLHGVNPNATWLSTLNIMLAGMFLLGMGYLLTGRLGLSIGVHITWNFFQGNVFGFPVSGIPSTVSFVAVEQRGDDLLTGGAFGPEAGLIGLAAMLLGAALTVLWVRWQQGKAVLDLAIAAPPAPRGAAAESPAQAGGG